MYKRGIIDPFVWLSVLQADILLYIIIFGKYDPLSVFCGWSVSYLSVYFNIVIFESIFLKKHKISKRSKIFYAFKPLLLLSVVTILILGFKIDPYGLLIGISSLFIATIIAAGLYKDQLLEGADNART